jgi:hypothetical protein
MTNRQYTEITAEYPLAAAKAFANLPPPPKPFKFVYVSGGGATTTPGRFTPLFGRVKGQAEAALLELSKTMPNLRVYSIRAGAVDPHLQPEIWPYIPTPKSALMRAANTVLLPVVRTVGSGIICPTRELGVFMTGLAGGDGGVLEGKGISGEGRTVSNEAFRRMAGLSS